MILDHNLQLTMVGEWDVIVYACEYRGDYIYYFQELGSK